MKIIALLPCKNAAWILPTYLSSIDSIVDEIIVIDESTDNSPEILKNNKKVKIYSNNDFLESGWDEFHIREKLLELGRKAGGTHFICLDADEALSCNFIHNAREIIGNLRPGQKLVLQWIFCWKNVETYIDDKRSDFSNNFKDFVFCDDRKMCHEFSFMHVGRTPGKNTKEVLIKLDNELGICLHFAYVDWLNCILKQSWLKCSELIKTPKNHIKINNKYYILDKNNIVLARTPRKWLCKLDLPKNTDKQSRTWYFDGIIDYFNKYGIEFFELLDIWGINELHQEFLKRVGRKPKSSKLHIYLRPIIKLKRRFFKLIKK